MAEEDSDLITLVDEEGHDHQFSLVDMVELNEHRYALLMPIEDEEIGEDDEEEAYIFRLETDEKGTDTLVDIDDDEEFEQVRVAFEDEGDDDDEEDE